MLRLANIVTRHLAKKQWIRLENPPVNSVSETSGPVLFVKHKTKTSINQ